METFRRREKQFVADLICYAYKNEIRLQSSLLY